MSKDNVNGKITRIELEMAVDQLKELIPAALQMYPLQARALKGKFDTLIDAGFTEKQALDIVMARPIFE